MIFRRLYEDDLAQASYIVGCERTRLALVVDPTRDVERYLAEAADQRLRLAFVTETHIHADYASGSRALARRAGAQLLLSGEGGPDWSYRFAEAEHARLLRDGDSIEVGSIRIRALHTPGHTPEHLTFVVIDAARSEEPVGAMTGDFIFVGDVGRPDLLERAAGLAGTMDEAARTLFASLQRFRAQPEFLQLWPGHGAGSACGKSLGAMPQSTLGFESRSNWALLEEQEYAFVQKILDGQPEPPRYFARMKRINRDDQLLAPLPVSAPSLEAAALAPLLERGAQVVDVRPTGDYALRHARGSMNVPADKAFANWAGSLLDDEQDVYLIGPTPSVERATRVLGLIGYDRVAGAFSAAALDAARVEMGSIPQITPAALQEELKRDAVTLLDVRSSSEWRDAHVAGAIHIPLAELRARIGEVPGEGTLVLHCQGGSRSAIAASVLAAAGRRDVVNLASGMRGWQQAGLPVERDHAGSEAPTT